MSPGPRRRATIITVAREAGVAASTVSRAFTSPGRVNAATRAHIMAVAERLGYAPNPAAQALESGRTNAVAVVVPDIGNPRFAGVIQGAERAAAAAQVTLVLGDSQADPATEKSLVRRLGPGVDGFVLADSRLPDAALRRASELDRIVLVDRTVEGLPSVVADYRAGTRDIVDHLDTLGHRSFVFLAGPAESWPGEQRWAGLAAAAEERGLGIDRLGPFAPTPASGPAAAEAVLRSDACAVVAHDDLLAVGVLQQLLARGVKVPDELSVIGFDDVLGAELCHPPLTTLAERVTESGVAAVQALVPRSRPEGFRPPRYRVLPTRLVVRGSSGPVAERPAAARSDG